MGTIGSGAHGAEHPIASRVHRAGPVQPTQSGLGRLSPLSQGDVVLVEGGDLGDWQLRNSVRTIPHCIAEVRSSGALKNLERAAQRVTGGARHQGMHFSDSDVYKLLEATAWDGFRGLEPEVGAFVEEATGLIARAQRQDGYINSWFQVQHPELVWSDFRWGHELYCVGHLLQAAVAAERTSNCPGIVAVADRLVSHLVATFSMQDGDGRLAAVCGHPEIETALVEWYRLSGDDHALQLAKRHVELRGRPGVPLPSSGLLGDDRFPMSYFLHHLPLRRRATATGHAVRELYLQAGAVDVAVETKDEELLDASERIWEDLFGTKTYITGSHGSRHRDESIGDAYELPSDRAYAETCAAIASFQWNWRLLLATGRARYAEAMEHVFWNTIAGSLSRDGTAFFYSNTLHLRTGHGDDDEDVPRHRLPRYECFCCPPNLARLMASIQLYLLTRDPLGLQVHMPFNGSVSTTVPGGAVAFSVRTGHPWDGSTELSVTRSTSGQPWDLSFRLPGWANSVKVQAMLNGRAITEPPADGYLKVTKTWEAGDSLTISVGMPIRVSRAHWRVDALRASAALQRGPFVYCLEADDLPPGVAVEDVVLDTSQEQLPTQDVAKELEGYVKVSIAASGQHLLGTDGRLYDQGAVRDPETEPIALKFVPYFARCNRPLGSMRVWVPTDGRTEMNGPPPTRESVTNEQE